eukprot:TRINITY_DN1140_c0_g1_i1.p1 TRINITY_DN1140_c0_g1~~TRINITY_DN1140_c0_g1_i1.p1  ORF type:complete len:158 (+),score=47.30 TRINITY_DN1140_c0_g1_i1:81-554(+)
MVQTGIFCAVVLAVCFLSFVPSTAADCFGNANGTAVIDACGVCGGNNQSCCLNFLGLDNSIWDWLLLRAAIDDIVGKLFDLSYVLECASRNVPRVSPNCTDASTNSLDLFKGQIKALQVADFIDTNNAWNSRCLTKFNDNVKAWTCVLNPAECCAQA